MPFKSVPVSILTGFLGAGKTTLLNHIIKENPNTKFAIIENEFGEINIDSELVIKTDENIFELSNGCICCSLNGDLFEVLNKLVNFYDNLEDIIEKAIEFDDVNKTKKTLSILNTFLSLEKTYGKNFFTNFINNELLEKLYITSEKQKISQNINTKRNIQKNKISKI